MCDAPRSEAGNPTPNIRPEKVRTPGLALVRTVLENPGMGTSPGSKTPSESLGPRSSSPPRTPGQRNAASRKRKLSGRSFPGPRALEQSAKVSAPLADYFFVPPLPSFALCQFP
jgi:hypothetical protein